MTVYLLNTEHHPSVSQNICTTHILLHPQPGKKLKDPSLKKLYNPTGKDLQLDEKASSSSNHLRVRQTRVQVLATSPGLLVSIRATNFYIRIDCPGSPDI